MPVQEGVMTPTLQEKLFLARDLVAQVATSVVTQYGVDKDDSTNLAALADDIDSAALDLEGVIYSAAFASGEACKNCHHHKTLSGPEPYGDSVAYKVDHDCDITKVSECPVVKSAGGAS